MEAPTYDQTRYEIYNQLYVERELAISPDSGTQVKANAWARIDWLLDALVDVDGIESLLEASQDGSNR